MSGSAAPPCHSPCHPRSRSYYLSQPERITGTEYTICADVWSTGLTILELVQNRFPFPGDLGPVDLIMHITASEVGNFGAT